MHDTIDNPQRSAVGKTMPLVAIVTPVYNGEKFLERCMRSVQAQTYPNIVHVVLNNASKDHSGEIINAFMNGKVKVEVHNNPETLPLYANWSKALSHTPENAVYVKWLCADDLMRHDCIERFVELCEANPAVEVALSHSLRGDVVRMARLPASTLVHNGRKVAKRIIEDKNGYMSFHHFFARMHPDYRATDFFDKLWAPDTHMVIRCAMRGAFGYIPEPLVFDRFNPDSVSLQEIKKRGVLFQLVNMHLFKEFQEQVYGTDSRGRQAGRRARDAYCIDSCRFIVRWWISGQKERSDQLSRALKENGFKLTPWHYIASLLFWPAHTILYRIRNSARGPHIDEVTYTNPVSRRNS